MTSPRIPHSIRRRRVLSRTLGCSGVHSPKTTYGSTTGGVQGHETTCFSTPLPRSPQHRRDISDGLTGHWNGYDDGLASLADLSRDVPPSRRGGHGLQCCPRRCDDTELPGWSCSETKAPLGALDLVCWSVSANGCCLGLRRCPGRCSHFRSHCPGRCSRCHGPVSVPVPCRCSRALAVSVPVALAVSVPVALAAVPGCRSRCPGRCSRCRSRCPGRRSRSRCPGRCSRCPGALPPKLPNPKPPFPESRCCQSPLSASP